MNNMCAAKLCLELRAKRRGVVIEPTFMTGPSMSYDIHVDTAVAMLTWSRLERTRPIDIC